MAREKIEITRQQLQQIARFELTFPKLLDGADRGKASLVCEPYVMTMEDVSCMVQRVRETPQLAGTFASDWLVYTGACYWDAEPLFAETAKALGLYQDRGEPEDYTAALLPLTERDYVEAVLRDIAYALEDVEGDDDDETPLADVFPFTCVDDWLTAYLHNAGRPQGAWDFPLVEKQRFIRQADEAMYERTASQRDIDFFRKFTDELAAADDEMALAIKGYQAYEGTAAYGQDFSVSFALISRAFDLTGDAGFANTLGYDCYYGRVNGGVPEYDKALKYFTYGAAVGVTESVYKLADMLAGGLGIHQNKRAAYNLICSVYEGAKEEFCRGAWGNPFADIALRMGRASEEGWDGYGNPETAYVYYLEAEYAIRKRLSQRDFFGDGKVAQGIREGLSRVRQVLQVEPVPDVQEEVVAGLWPADMERIFASAASLQLRIRESGKKTYRLELRRSREGKDSQPGKLLFALPLYEYCELANKLTLEVTVSKAPDMPLDRWLYVDSCRPVFKGNRDFPKYEFYDGHYKVGTIFSKAGPYLVLERHNGGDQTVYHMASVCFVQGGQLYDYICDDPAIAPGDRAVVETPQGESVVQVVRLYDCRARDLLLPLARYKHLGRKVTE